ncbi:toll/interleukin-1 receptor-like protein [Helianthus annuus]|uniref:toll/interleukin-1 receptor-like protein n=1 Tax=Helianthus annuus TaxID=4232 RepID=UPI000B8F3257|nr:toll/interleukin-1 receptor-like protein [Helianthus annuus]
MAWTSASLVQKPFKYDVFLSFRGEDTRKTFVDHLYHALLREGITTYKDDERIEKGERISDQLITSIEDSRFYIIVFSKNYASSSWCLNELVKIMECQKTMVQTAHPIFYDVEPTEVRYQCGAVGEAFAKHVDNEAAWIWRDALKEAAGLAGWELPMTRLLFGDPVKQNR